MNARHLVLLREMRYDEIRAHCGQEQIEVAAGRVGFLELLPRTRQPERTSGRAACIQPNSRSSCPG